MDPLDIMLLAERDPGEAIGLARLHGFEKLAEELTAARTKVEKRTRNPFPAIRLGRVTIAYAAAAISIPKSTAQAASVERISGALSKAERARLRTYLVAQRAFIDQAIELCGERA